MLEIIWTTASLLEQFSANFLSCKEMPLDWNRYQIPDPWPYQEARRLFKEPVVTPTEELPEFKWNAPDEEVFLLP
jgi:hypothetical protein